MLFFNKVFERISGRFWGRLSDDFGQFFGCKLEHLEPSKINNIHWFLYVFGVHRLPETGRKPIFFGGRFGDRFWEALGVGFGGQKGAQNGSKTAKNRCKKRSQKMYKKVSGKKSCERRGGGGGPLKLTNPELPGILQGPLSLPSCLKGTVADIWVTCEPGPSGQVASPMGCQGVSRASCRVRDAGGLILLAGFMLEQIQPK